MVPASRRPIVIALMAWMLCVPLLAQQGDWAVRATARVTYPPTEADLGIYVQVPNGGLLPRSPVPEVQDAAGNVLESTILWTSDEAMGIVFRPPTDGGREVSLLFRDGRAGSSRPPATNLKPSLFLMTRNVQSPSLEAARRMASEYPPAQGAQGGAIDRIGIRYNPFGNDDNFITWYTGWFKLAKPETIYFATISADGSEIWLDGKLHVAWPGVHTRDAGAKGQFGKDAKLEAGWHKIDYYHFGTAGKYEKEMFLAWRREGTPKGELPTYMEGDAWGRSGTAQITRMQTRDGAQMAWMDGNLQADHYLWVEEANAPVNFYTVRSSGLLTSDEAVTSWDFGQGRVVTNAARASWLLGGMAATAAGEVTLVTRTAAGEARQKARLASFVSPRRASLDRPQDRLSYRQAFYAMIMAAPVERDPVAGWSGDLWATLIAVMEPYRGGPILMELFSRGVATLRRLPKEQRWALEDRYAETLRLARNTEAQLAWIDKTEADERDRVRQFRWKEERISALLYDAGDVNAARAAALAMREAAKEPEEIQRAVLRLGDVEWMARERDKAARFYADAEERFRSRNTLGRARGGLQQVGAVRAGTRPALSSLLDAKGPDTWKLYAVNDVAQSSTVRTYLDQDEILEAMEALRKWENMSPTSKLSGEFLMAEARFYAAMEDYRRVAAILGTYRAMNSMTGQMPAAMDMNLMALIELRRYDEARALALEGMKRFPGLPVAERAENFLRQLNRREQ